MTNRPSIQPLGNLSFPNFSSSKLSNQIPIDFIEVDLQDLVVLDFVFGVGTAHQKNFFVNTFASKMLLEGTSKHSSKQISEFLDFHGASVSPKSDREYSRIRIVVLRKYLPQFLPFLYEVFTDSIFPEAEFEIKRRRFRQSFEVDEQTVETMAYRGFFSCIYGAEGTFGRIPVLSDIDNLQLDWVRNFYRDYYRFENLKIYISGKFSDNDYKMIDDTFGSIPLSTDYAKPKFNYIESPFSERQLYLPKKDSVQSCVRIGRRLFHLNDASDLDGFCVLNTVLGGYFGSRLMKNIREEKGFTYGIGSGLSYVSNDVIWGISTQAGNQYVEPLLEEVYHEIELLQNELIPEKELTQVKNYATGVMLRTTENVSSLISYYVTLDLLSKNFPQVYQKRAEVCRNISAEKIRCLAQKYLQKSTLYEVVAG